MAEQTTFICMIRPKRPGFLEELLPEEQEAMAAHVAYLNTLVKERKFYLIGPCTDRAFGISIFEAESLEVARDLMAHDPVVQRGVMHFEVHPYYISYHNL
ncbi:YciI family protein [Ktedonospora formicarum]|uniref:YCII-related domain-containing protein n=1 Tax=Ktedonospora formicarum TaxID=2778364 RepID=A0A8J3IC46_9CHLR|nr:YciI family protein [Ktedonospora formicarum]GHO49578.1 hypothetical protein KSX_77410 [Ktedonospora formicarum]